LWRGECPKRFEESNEKWYYKHRILYQNFKVLASMERIKINEQIIQMQPIGTIIGININNIGNTSIIWRN